MARTLYQVFVLPALSMKSTNLSSSPLRRVPISATSPSRRWLSSSRNCLAALPGSSSPPKSPKYRPPEKGKPRDAEIKSKFLRLLNPQTGRPEESPTSRWQALRSYDPATHYLEQITPDDPTDPGFVPLCRIVNKKEAYEAEKARKLAAKASKKSNAKISAAGLKTIEMSWAIGGGDLSHRLDRLKEFLEDGRRVDVVLAKKKGGRRATVEECEALLKNIHECVQSVSGAREYKDKNKPNAPSRLGALMTLSFVGKEQNVAKQSSTRPENQTGEAANA